MVCAEGRREGRAGADMGGLRGCRGILGWLNRRDRPDRKQSIYQFGQRRQNHFVKITAIGFDSHHSRLTQLVK